MARTVTSGQRPTAARYAACYALYAVVLALGYLTFTLWRVTGLLVVGALLGRRTAGEAIYGLLVVVVGIVLFVVALAAEPYLRGGVRRRQVLGRFARLAVPLAIAIALAVLAQEAIRLLAQGGRI